MIRSFFPLLLLIACQSAFPLPGKAAPDAIDELFGRWDSPGQPGCAVSVIRDGKRILFRAYGMANLEHNVPITEDTAFYIASTSKQFTAISVLLAARLGRLSLDDDIRKYLPEMPDYGAPVTVRQLIHHTGGVRDYLRLWWLSGRSFLDYMTEEQVLDLIARQENLSAPSGEKFSYSNSGYFLLGVILKRSTGMTLREFAEEHIF